ncbi:hypothetical protein HYALB_00010520 [Hymenoscyphus albidus]|uniref:Uncharacterized protein n=1 Tax=Hymenoscyphus albidus TaxID=595503 RepID=A0A9N9M520_9HELO|nr:hypothetical protein HYALB_00010520 [Hymenoscyphus albidus]
MEEKRVLAEWKIVSQISVHSFSFKYLHSPVLVLISNSKFLATLPPDVNSSNCRMCQWFTDGGGTTVVPATSCYMAIRDLGRRRADNNGNGYRLQAIERFAFELLC